MKNTNCFLLSGLLILGAGTKSFGACTNIYSNFSMNSNQTTCYVIHGNNITFNGNGKTLFGNSAEASKSLIKITGSGVTVKDLKMDCNSKQTGIESRSTGTSKIVDVEVSNCVYGIAKHSGGLTVDATKRYGSMLFNNSFGVADMAGAGHTYTSNLIISGKGGTGVVTNSPYYYDYKSLLYSLNVGFNAHNVNSLFMLDHSYSNLNKSYDILLVNIPKAYLTQVSYTKLTKHNSTVIEN